jgi:hypothetical protein
MANNSPIASPRGTAHLGEKLKVLAKTKVPSASRIHMPMPVLLRESEKEASTLHFNLPCNGRCQDVVNEEVEAMSE